MADCGRYLIVAPDDLIIMSNNLQYSISSSTQLETKPLIQSQRYSHPSSFIGKLSLLCKGPQRLWSTTLIALVAALTALIGGYTIGYPSSSLIDLDKLNGSRAIKNDSVLANLYGVSLSVDLWIYYQI